MDFRRRLDAPSRNERTGSLSPNDRGDRRLVGVEERRSEPEQERSSTRSSDDKGFLSLIEVLKTGEADQSTRDQAPGARLDTGFLPDGCVEEERS